MELNLKVPEGLGNRLRAYESRLVEILELGLAAFEDNPPTPEELLAYSRRELDDGKRAALTERLALDSASVDDLLDLEHFEDLEPPSEAHRLSDNDVRRSLADFRTRVAMPDQEGSADDASKFATANLEPDSHTKRSDGDHKSPPEEPRSPRNRPLRRRSLPAWLAVAAGLLLALGLWTWEPSAELQASHVYQVRVTTSRSDIAVVTVPTEAQWIALRFDPQDLLEPRGLLRIVSREEGVVFEQAIETAGASDNLLLVTLEANLLQPGYFHAEFLDRTGQRQVADGLPFVVERSAEGSRSSD